MSEYQVWRATDAAGARGPRAAVPLAWLGVLLAVAGCSKGPAPETRATEEAKAFGALPGLRATPDQPLQAELARVVDEGGTPELLAARKIADESNVAAGLVALFADLDRQRVAGIRAEAAAIFPKGPSTFDPVQREKAIRFRQRYDDQRLGARLALDRPECRFPIAFEAGPADELAFLDPVWICSRLEAFQAAEMLASGNVDSGLESLHFMLRLAECLAAEPHPITRLEAAFLRTEALVVLQAIVGSEKFQRRHAITVHGWLSDQLTRWPDDSLAWIGDRAQGMVIYEAVRGGKLTDYLSDKEKEQLRAEGSLSAFEAAALRGANADELYYLVSMRKILDSCREPYYTRVKGFEELARDLHEKRNSPDFPLVAGRFLLLDVEKGHVIQARDRANCEAWVLALALACGGQTPAAGNNPLTGHPYRVERDGKAILVYDIGTGVDGDNPPWIVPDMSVVPGDSRGK